ncbi:Late embryogenesis abundant (LEA) hydroxyproline-rich glycoprotein family [Melia azedarach]|uniref:Late embryogenesis abundant (LEA) hydroxyproline-rich glycoprotein family n=1 Tax=Melia azedarach TaxID=155640 RepID=A0ACC1YNF4_MELAZ|nr:Late embryogenesis abundant (LEA) hydroxyproline-rich glycoprotein family [Melia azedarach]
MAERVHPQTTSHEDEELGAPRPAHPPPQKPVPPPAGTYVVQIPKDQVYRVPPPENADRLKRLSGRKSSRGRACCCCRFFCCSLLLLILLVAIAAAVFYFVFRPEAPKYSIDSVSISGLNLTSASSPILPEFDVTVRADNPNNKIGIYYEKGSSVKVYYRDVNLCNGALPQFFQPRNNVTVFKTALKGSAIELTSSVRNDLVADAKSQTVPFKVNLRVPVKIKVGSVKTWTIKVKVKCDLTVDQLTAKSKIVSKDCDYGVKLW